MAEAAPVVNGQVTFVDMLTHKQEHRDNDSSKHASTRTTYEPVVRYHLRAGGPIHWHLFSLGRLCLLLSGLLNP